jgi:hypothetical protein
VKPSNDEVVAALSFGSADAFMLREMHSSFKLFREVTKARFENLVILSHGTRSEKVRSGSDLPKIAPSILADYLLGILDEEPRLQLESRLRSDRLLRLSLYALAGTFLDSEKTYWRAKSDRDYPDGELVKRVREFADGFLSEPEEPTVPKSLFAPIEKVQLGEIVVDAGIRWQPSLASTDHGAVPSLRSIGDVGKLIERARYAREIAAKVSTLFRHEGEVGLRDVDAFAENVGLLSSLGVYSDEDDEASFARRIPAIKHWENVLDARARRGSDDVGRNLTGYAGHFKAVARSLEELPDSVTLRRLSRPRSESFLVLEMGAYWLIFEHGGGKLPTICLDCMMPIAKETEMVRSPRLLWVRAGTEFHTLKGMVGVAEEFPVAESELQIRLPGDVTGSRAPKPRIYAIKIKAI